MFFQRSRCVFSSVSRVLGGFFKFMKIMIFHNVWVQKNRPWAKPFGWTVLGSYFMKINDILTKWMLKTYSMWEKCVQIMYSSINKSKICIKWAQATDSMGRIRTAYFLCTRITLETTALRVAWSFAREGPVFFPDVQVCGFECFSDYRGFFQIHEKSWFFTTYGSKKIAHEPNPLTAPYSAHILWKLMIF